MKKAVKLVGLFLTLTLFLVACATKEKEEKEKLDTAKEATSDQSTEMLEVTIPANLFDQEGMSDMNAQMKKEGVKAVTVNGDGSITYSLSKEAHQKLLDAVKKSIDESISEILADKVNYPSYTEITYNDQMTQLEVKVDAAIYEGTATFDALQLYALGSKYQSVNLVSETDIKTQVDFVDKDTKEVIETCDSVSAGASYQQS